MIKSRWVQAMFAALGVVLLGGAGTARADVVTCSSRDNDYSFCPADTSDGVYMRRQLSHSDCTLNRSWGFDRRGIWVDKGCRAEFNVAGRSDNGRGWNDGRGSNDRRDHPYGTNQQPGYGWGYNRRQPRQFVDCASDGKTRYCRVPVYDRVELVEQYSRSSCTYPRSWRYDRNGIYVDDGCRGRFAVY